MAIWAQLARTKCKAPKAKSRAASCLASRRRAAGHRRYWGASYPESLKWQDGDVLFCHLAHLCLLIPIFSFKNVLFFLMSYQHCCSYICLIITLFSSPQYHKVAFVRAVNQGSSETCEKWVGFNNIFISVLKTDWEEYD